MGRTAPFSLSVNENGTLKIHLRNQWRRKRELMIIFHAFLVFTDTQDIGVMVSGVKSLIPPTYRLQLFFQINKGTADGWHCDIPIQDVEL